ncbi:MAG: hypothetical protein FD149_2450 [Rhodospirillaceae bacterium]|nr:MAG: hypothetical protein FD149_2450 [Rhodospirillaceae bacterium]
MTKWTGLRGVNGGRSRWHEGRRGLGRATAPNRGEEDLHTPATTSNAFQSLSRASRAASCCPSTIPLPPRNPPAFQSPRFRQPTRSRAPTARSRNGSSPTERGEQERNAARARRPKATATSSKIDCRATLRFPPRPARPGDAGQRNQNFIPEGPPWVHHFLAISASVL